MKKRIATEGGHRLGRRAIATGVAAVAAAAVGVGVAGPASAVTEAQVDQFADYPYGVVSVVVNKSQTTPDRLVLAYAGPANAELKGDLAGEIERTSGGLIIGTMYEPVWRSSNVIFRISPNASCDLAFEVNGERTVALGGRDGQPVAGTYAISTSNNVRWTDYMGQYLCTQRTDDWDNVRGTGDYSPQNSPVSPALHLTEDILGLPSNTIDPKVFDDRTDRLVQAPVIVAQNDSTSSALGGAKFPFVLKDDTALASSAHYNGRWQDTLYYAKGKAAGDSVTVGLTPRGTNACQPSSDVTYEFVGSGVSHGARLGLITVKNPMDHNGKSVCMKRTLNIQNVGTYREKFDPADSEMAFSAGPINVQGVVVPRIAPQDVTLPTVRPSANPEPTVAPEPRVAEPPVAEPPVVEPPVVGQTPPAEPRVEPGTDTTTGNGNGNGNVTTTTTTTTSGKGTVATTGDDDRSVAQPVVVTEPAVVAEPAVLTEDGTITELTLDSGSTDDIVNEEAADAADEAVKTIEAAAEADGGSNVQLLVGLAVMIAAMGFLAFWWRRHKDSRI